MLGLERGTVNLIPYQSVWKEEFKKEKSILESIISGYALDIQHVGSTSIVGLSAKPIIDIAVAVSDKQKLYDLIPVMESAGYEIKNSIEDKGELLAVKGVGTKTTHLIHIEVKGSTFWNNHILFRDYLLSHPEYITKYEQLKTELFEKYKDDRPTYTESKHAFIQDIINKALQEKIN